MDVINIPNEETNFEVSQSLLHLILCDNSNAWLSLMLKGRISKRLLRSMEKIAHSDILSVVRIRGIQDYNLPDTELERIISLYFNDHYQLSYALKDSFHRLQQERLIQAIKECPNEIIQE